MYLVMDVLSMRPTLNKKRFLDSIMKVGSEGLINQFQEIKARVIAGERPAIPLGCPPLFGQLIVECWDQGFRK